MHDHEHKQNGDSDYSRENRSGMDEPVRDEFAMAI